jgi:hypothetical protein
VAVAYSIAYYLNEAACAVVIRGRRTQGPFNNVPIGYIDVFNWNTRSRCSLHQHSIDSEPVKNFVRLVRVSVPDIGQEIVTVYILRNPICRMICPPADLDGGIFIQDEPMSLEFGTI